MCESQKIQTEEDTAFLLEHAHLTSDDDVESWESPDSQIGQWLPLDVNLCNEALCHCATDVTVDSVASTEVTSMQLTDGGCSSRQGDRWCPRKEGEEEVSPSDCRLVCALVLALLTTLGCGVVAGLAALFMVYKAKRRCDEGRYTEAKEYLNYAFFIVTVSVFFATPVYIYVFFHIHKSAL